jgi:SAM-dependent methyltransferase
VGDRNQRHFLERQAVEGPVLEVGSGNPNGNTQSFRDLFSDYVGVDITPGPGVDVVADLQTTVPEGSFGLVICCSVLEHVPDPWAMARNITRVLKPGGSVYVSVPWAWRYHAYPDDYWRFSWRGIERLFPDLEWDAPMFSTTREGELFPAVPDADNNLATVIEGRKFIPYLSLHMLGHAPRH